MEWPSSAPVEELHMVQCVPRVVVVVVLSFVFFLLFFLARPFCQWLFLSLVVSPVA